MNKELGENLKAFRRSAVGRAHEGFFVNCDSGKYFLKIGDDEDRFQVEGPAIGLLNERTKISVPDLVGFDVSGEEFGFMYLILEEVEGENLDAWENNSGPKFPYLSRNRKKSLLNSAGQELGLLHSQTSFEDFGHFRGSNEGLKFRQKGSWKDTFRKIIIKEQALNFPERFSHLEPLVKEFVDEFIDVIDTDRASLVHQDVRWPNIIAGDNSINALIDWERAIAGDPLYDLAKAEESLLQFKRGETRDRYRGYLIDGYNDFIDLPDNWRRVRGFYRALRPVEALWTFNGWTSGMEESRKDEMAVKKERKLKNRMESFRDSG